MVRSQEVLVVPGEITALISALSYALSYIYLNRAQSKGETSDNGLLPVLVISSVVLTLSFLVRQLWDPVELVFNSEGRRAVWYCIIAGISWNFLGRMTLYGSISRIGATRGVVIKSIAPIVTVIAAVVFLQEPLETTDVAGFALMLLSILLIVLERRMLDTRSHFRSVVAQGILLGVAAAFLQGIGHVLRKLGVDFVSPSLGAALDMTAAALAYLLYLVLNGRLLYHVRFYIRHLSSDVLAAGVLSVVGSLTFFIATASAPISNVAMILGMQPIFMPVLSSVFFRGFESFTWLSYLASALVFVGVMLLIISGA